METKELIESGTLELYVLQALPPEEQRQIEALRANNAEVNEEIARIETTLQQLATTQSRKPAPYLKTKIAEQLEFGIELDLDMENIKSIIIRMPGIYKYATAAAVLLMLSLGGTALYFQSKYSSMHRMNNDLAKENADLMNQVSNLATQNKAIQDVLAVVSDEKNANIVMKGLPLSPTATATVYWNKENGIAYVNCAGLPPVASNEQYQLWAIIDGKPVDMGVIEKTETFLKMKDVKNAAAFAITIEPQGGSVNPTLEKMVVLGKV